MAKSRKHGLIAALTLLSAIATSRPSFAQGESGFWVGLTFESFETITIGPEGDLEESFSSFTGPGSLFVQYDDMLLTITINGFSLTGFSEEDPFVTGSASFIIAGGHDGPDIGDFGQTGRHAAADLLLDNTGGNATGEIDQIEFNTVPEPGSLISAGTGFLAVTILAWRRLKPMGQET